MSDVTAAVAAPPTPAQAAPAAPPSRSDLIAAAARALGSEDAAPAEAAAEEAPALPSTPEAPATTAVLAQEETASSLIRLKAELGEARARFEADRAKWTTEQRESQGRLAAMERAFAEFDRDPAAFARARAAGRPLNEIARDIYLDDVKLEDLPPEHRESTAMKREISALRREQERHKAEQANWQAQQNLAAYRASLTNGLREVGEQTPLVKELAAQSPQTALQLMENIAGGLAVSQPELGIQTAAQLAARLEATLLAELKPFESYYERKFKPAAPAAPAPPGKTSRAGARRGRRSRSQERICLQGRLPAEQH